MMNAKKKQPKPRMTGMARLFAAPRIRIAPDLQTEAIKDNFPPGVARPALRALVAAGISELDQLTEVSEAELSAMHGMGPKAISVLRAALEAKGLHFRKS